MMSQALKATFSGFTKEQQRLGIPKGENRTTFTLTYERLRKLCSSVQLTQRFSSSQIPDSGQKTTWSSG